MDTNRTLGQLFLSVCQSTKVQKIKIPTAGVFLTVLAPIFLKF